MTDIAHNGKVARDIKATLEALRRFHRAADLVEALRFHGEFEGQAKNIVEPGEYANMRRTEATDRYLFLSPVPQTSAQIAEALKRGKVKSKAKDHYQAQENSMYYGKRMGRYRKYGTGDYWTVAR